MAAPSPRPKNPDRKDRGQQNKGQNQNTRKVHPIIPMASPSPRTKSAQTHAITHCPTTTPTAHFPPSSRRMEAMAATQGVYSRQKTKREATASGVSATMSCSVLPNRTDSVETTLSLAINPAISAVETRQSPKPRGTKRGEITPAMTAKMLFWESATTFNWKSNV